MQIREKTTSLATQNAKTKKLNKLTVDSHHRLPEAAPISEISVSWFKHSVNPFSHVKGLTIDQLGRFGQTYQMKLILPIVCAAGLLVTGCDHLAADGNLGRYYQPFVGTQTNWPINPTGGFVTTYDKFPIYHGLPPKPYVLIGRFDRADIPAFRMVACARYHQANAIMMVEKEISEYKTDNGMTFFNDRFAFTTPTTTHQVNRISGTGYLIQIIGEPVPPAPKTVPERPTGRR